MNRIILLIIIILITAGAIAFLFIYRTNIDISNNVILSPNDISLKNLQKINRKIIRFGYEDYDGDSTKELVLLYALSENEAVFTYYKYNKESFVFVSKTANLSRRNAYWPQEKPLISLNIDGRPGDEIVIEDGGGSYQAILFLLVRNDKLFLTQERDFSSFIDCRSYDNKYYLVESKIFESGPDLLKEMGDNSFGISRVSYLDDSGQLIDLTVLPSQLYSIIYNYYYSLYTAKPGLSSFVKIYSFAHKFSTDKIDETWIKENVRLSTHGWENLKDPASVDELVDTFIQNSQLNNVQFRQYVKDYHIKFNFFY